jgi:hypothetical protein
MNALTAGHAPATMGHNGGPPMAMDAASLLGFNDAEQRVWSYFLNQIHRIETEVFEIEYPDIRYADLIPVDTAGGEWLQAITYFSTDRVGAAQWFHAGAQDVPLVGMTKNAFATSVQLAAIGYGYNEEELAIATQLGQNLTADKAQICRRAAEEFIDRVAFNGDTTMGFQGLLNYSGITSSTVAAAWDVGTTTGDMILADVNAALTGMWTASSGIEMADTLLLPQEAFSIILTKPRTTTSDMTVMQFLRQANIYTQETGRPLTIRGLWGLNAAGAGSTGRMVAYRRDKNVLRMHMPMPFQFRQPWRKGPLMYEVPGIFRLGGLDIRRPGAVRYTDGITTG